MSAVATETVRACAPRDARTGAHTVTEIPVADAWLIWSYEHRAWWGPAFAGYTVHLLSAGVYTKAAAEDEARDPNDEEARRLLDVLRQVASSGRHGPNVGDALGVAL